jgi:DNA anti-recombination protein RmuC
MPVTAKLSKRFYDVLGEDVANELVDWFNAVDLTYRADLRELNELNFARFDAKLEQRLAELRAELRQEMAELRATLKQELAELRAEQKQELAELRAEQKQELAQLRADLIRWMFGFWITTLMTLAGLMVALRSG